MGAAGGRNAKLILSRARSTRMLIEIVQAYRLSPRASLGAFSSAAHAAAEEARREGGIRLIADPLTYAGVFASNGPNASIANGSGAARATTTLP